MRRLSRKIKVGKLYIGGDAPISVQSMTKTPTHDVDATVFQILQLEQAGCDIVRVAVPDEPSAQAIAAIKKQVNIPVVADIHFDPHLAILAIDAGADKIRLNPGTMGHLPQFNQVLDHARDQHIPIRIGVNSGSLAPHLLKQFGSPCAEALVASAMEQIQICEQLAFENIIVSLKASDVNTMVRAYLLIAQRIDYPLHLGVTEAGIHDAGLIKSAIGIGILLQQGIGDTIRVSLTDDPVREVWAGNYILQALNLRHYGINLISCPGCGRSEIDLQVIVRQLMDQVSHLKKPLTVAIMGCAVNGPAEARAADLGVVYGKNKASFFKRGKIFKIVPQAELMQELLDQIQLF